MRTVPEVSALSTRSLASHCSYCHSEGNTSSERTLKRCTLCKVVWYDTTVWRHPEVRILVLTPHAQTCQNLDWPIHKLECVALREWAKAARQVGVGSTNADVVLVPSDAVRALGRLLWTMEREGPSSTVVCDFNKIDIYNRIH